MKGRENMACYCFHVSAQHKQRKKDGKSHRYFSVVENQRVAGDRTVQRTVLYLGESTILNRWHGARRWKYSTKSNSRHAT